MTLMDPLSASALALGPNRVKGLLFHQKPSGFNETTTVFKFLLQKKTWNRNFSSEFHWNRPQKKLGGFPLNPKMFVTIF